MDTFVGQPIYILFLAGKWNESVCVKKMTVFNKGKKIRYFLWDTIIAIYFYKYQGISMVLHGMVSFSVFIFSFVSKFRQNQKNTLS